MNNYLELIGKLASSLGTTAENLFSVMVVQAKVQMFFDIFIIGVFLSFGLWIYKVLVPKLIKKEGRFADKDLVIIGWVLVWGFGCIISLITFIGISEIITCAVNPQYWALDQIMEMFK